MQLKYSRALVAAILTGIAFSASAQYEPDVKADSAQACPAGTIPSGASYTFEDGHLVRDGEVCTSLYNGRD